MRERAAGSEGRAGWAIFVAELRSLRRSAFPRVYAVSAIAGIGASLLLAFHWHGVASRLFTVLADIAPPNILGWYGAPILCVALAGVVALAATRSGSEQDLGFEALHARPFATASLLAGRLLAQVVWCWWPMAAALAGVQCVGAVGAALSASWGGVMRMDALLVLLLLDLPVALVLFAGATTLVAVAIRSRAAAVVCGLALVAGYGLALTATPSYLLPAVNLVSDFGKQPSELLATFSAETFLQRTATALAAAGLVALCVWRHPRPARGRRRALALGGAFCVAGLAVPAGFAWLAAERLALRQAWRSAHVEALTQPAADAAIERIQGHVRIVPRRGLELDLTVGLRVASADASPLRFSFNPGLTVRELRLDDEAVPYTHESGLLTVGRSAGSASAVSMRLRAAGVPDANFGYLDSPLEWRALPARHPLLRLGKDAAIDDKRFVALMPAVRWLPAIGVNVGERRWAPFLLDLRVKAPPGWLVAGPGRRETAGGPFRFAPSVPVADVALVAAPYERHATEVAGVRVEVLAAPGHLDNVAELGIAEPLAARLGGLLNRLADLDLPYPHRALTVVEVPMRLRTYGDGWRMADLALPGLFLVREAHLTTPRFAHEGAGAATAEDRARWFAFYFAFESEISGRNPFSALARQAFGLQTAAEGPDALGLGFVLNNLATQLLSPSHADRFAALDTGALLARQSGMLREQMYTSWGAQGGFSEWLGDVLARWTMLPIPGASAPPSTAEREADAAWRGAGVAMRSFGVCAQAAMLRRVRESGAPTPLSSPTEAGDSVCVPVADGRRFVAALHRKADAIRLTLSDALGEERIGTILAEVRRRHAGGGYRLQDVANADPEREIGDFLEYWLSASGLPGFLASAPTVARLPDAAGAPRYQTRVHVFNGEPVDGWFALSVAGPPPAGRTATLMEATGPRVLDTSPPVRLAANAAAEVGMVTAFPPKEITIAPYLSHNREHFRVPPPAFSEDIVDAPPLVGVQPSAWRPPAEVGIVVDDLDAGFAIAPAGDAARGEIEPAPWLPFYEAQGAPAWGRLRWSTAWGKYRRTVARTLAGNGREAAVFRAHLPVAGRWRLAYHWPEWREPTIAEGHPQAAAEEFGLRRYYDQQGPYAMRVVTAAGVATVVDFTGVGAEAGWNALGDFDLAAGEVRLVVSNQTPGDSVIADAIRWLRLDEQNPGSAGVSPAKG